MASIPSYVRKYLRFKPEVTQIFEDLEQYHDWVRLQYPQVRFNEADMYREKCQLWQRYQEDKYARRR